MARTTKPEFLATEDMGVLGRERLEQFMSVLRDRPTIMCGVLGIYSTCPDAVSHSREVEADTADPRGIAIRALGGLLECDADLDAQPDDNTLTRMRADISRAKSEGNVRGTRLIRLGTLADEVAAWQALNPDTADAPSPGSGAGSRTGLDVVFLEPRQV